MLKSNIYSLKAIIRGGASLEATVKEILKLSRQLKCEISFEFNDTSIIINSFVKYGDIILGYYEKRGKS